MIETMLKAAKAAKEEVAALDTARKNAALNAMADALIASQTEILSANAADLDAAAARFTATLAQLLADMRRVLL